jgi:glycosyltransferase involved in cell wall biosynthesis
VPAGPDRRPARRRRPIPDAAWPPGRDLLFVGRLDPEKGVQLLLDAWAAREEPRTGARRLVVAGDGPLRPLVRRHAAADPSIEYLGRVDASAVERAMRAAAAVVLPSVWLEGLPRVAVEAMALGRPLIAVRHGGLATVVDPSNGWLLEPTVAAWAGLLGSLDQADLDRRGAGARAGFLARFDQAVTTRQLLAAYDGVLAA